MLARLLQFAGALTLLGSAAFVVLLVFGYGEHGLVQWIPPAVVLGSLAILIPMLAGKDKGERKSP